MRNVCEMFEFQFFSSVFACVVQAKLSRFLKAFYTDLALKESIIPEWAPLLTAPGSLCSARLEPELRFHPQSHGINNCISIEQLLTSIQVSV